MDVEILKIERDQHVTAKIEEGYDRELPTTDHGWRYNFEKFSKGKNNKVYVLVTNETPEVIEGCMIFKLLKDEPIMAYIEIAPHNKGLERIYDLVAGNLISYACKLSFEHGKNNFKGWLSFTVQEKSEEDQSKLMELYSSKYDAVKVTKTAMVIHPSKGELLIEKYLKIKMS